MREGGEWGRKDGESEELGKKDEEWEEEDEERGMKRKEGWGMGQVRES